jgi:hypothetical protein
MDVVVDVVRECLVGAHGDVRRLYVR